MPVTTVSGPRFYCPLPLRSGAQLDLPAGAVRHAQVLRLQPGSNVILFNGGLSGCEGGGGELEATVTQMGRNSVAVQIGAHHAIEREAPVEMHLAVGMPANERMDWLVEKTIELGVASIQPLMTERSVVRLHGEREEKKRAHWQAIAIAACEQCGRNRVPLVHPVRTLAQWLAPDEGKAWPNPIWRVVLSLAQSRLPLADLLSPRKAMGQLLQVGVLSGPEGGLSDAEENLVFQAGFTGASLGPRILRAETAAIAVLAALGTLG